MSDSLQADQLQVKVFRMFEHEVLSVGDRFDNEIFTLQHFQSLLTLSSNLGNRYFQVGHQQIRFRQYVGVISTPTVQIEILPKTDRTRGRTAGQWQSVLIDMLRACRFVRKEFGGVSLLDSRPGYLLEWYVSLFLQELETLQRNGLLHTYEETSRNQTVWKGQLQFAQQIKYNHLHQERFFVRFHEFTDRHPANLMLAAALERLEVLPLSANLRARLRYLKRVYPQSRTSAGWFAFYQELAWRADRRLDRYDQALTIAHHILRDHLPDIRSGAYVGLALLFDMNALFEEYLYRQLLRWQPEGCRVERQLSRVFWGRNRLRPDLVITTPGTRIVLDTKWRASERVQPSAEELRQIYVYCDYFKAEHGVLIYPRTGEEQTSQCIPFSPMPGKETRPERVCQVQFAPVINANGRLRPDLGRMIFEELKKI